MATLPKPSPMLIMDLDESLVTKEVREEINRCYPSVARVQIRTHETPEDGDVHNTIRLMVLYSYPYLHSADEDADKMWDEVVEHWLHSIIYKVSNQMKIYNRRQREIEGVELNFDALVVELEDGEVEAALHLDSNSDIDAECVKLLTHMRTLLNAGTLGEGVKRVSMPSAASYAKQYEEGMAAKEEREAAAAAEEEAKAQAEAEAAANAEAEADEAFLESPELTEEEERTAEDIDLEVLGYEIEKKFSFPEVDFALDYRVWDIAYADGSTREFDSEAASFVE